MIILVFDENEENGVNNYNSLFEMAQKVRFQYSKLQKDIKSYFYQEPIQISVNLLYSQEEKKVKKEENIQDQISIQMPKKIEIIDFEVPKEKPQINQNILKYKIRRLKIAGRTCIDRF